MWEVSARSLTETSRRSINRVKRALLESVGVFAFDADCLLFPKRMWFRVWWLKFSKPKLRIPKPHLFGIFWWFQLFHIFRMISCRRCRFLNVYANRGVATKKPYLELRHVPNKSHFYWMASVSHPLRISSISGRQALLQPWQADEHWLCWNDEDATRSRLVLPSAFALKLGCVFGQSQWQRQIHRKYRLQL